MNRVLFYVVMLSSYVHEHTCWASKPYNMCFLLRYKDYHGPLRFVLFLASDMDIHCIKKNVREHVKLDTTTMDISWRHSAT